MTVTPPGRRRDLIVSGSALAGRACGSFPVVPLAFLFKVMVLRGWREFDRARFAGRRWQRLRGGVAGSRLWRAARRKSLLPFPLMRAIIRGVP